MKKSNSIFLFLLFVISGCMTITPPMMERPIEKEKVYNKSYDEVWKAAMSVFVKSAGIASTVDKQSGIIGFTNNLSKEDMDDFVAEKAPTIPLGSQFGQGQLYVNIIVSPIDRETTRVFLKTKVTGSLLNAYGYPVQYNISLTSNGKLEEEFFKKMSAELGLLQYDYLQS
ncbi:MAG: hypothetical protein PHS93_03715 [Candidatus Omnitrophica bacterium]|nr:hypothetical protein [Candidatus Omnitrophota bacterium]MDD5352259.1 hypothetical protein [Candidatus Omnitrophota bacterium]MDD5549857.1 hypothetical protein [Candidatus Omnitrophota bacterium]